jgi:sigma-B regulation protein RsbU (phosphoserine phosphatase)
MDYTLVGVVDNREVRFPLAEGKHLVGRADDAGFQLAQANVSRRHAEIEVNGDKVVVRDLGSHNGTHVNGEEIVGDVPLRLGDRLELANLTFRVEGPINVGKTRDPLKANVVPSAEISWDEVRSVRSTKKDLQSLLFRVLAKAGDLLTIPRAPEEMYEPILDLAETALLKPERVFVLLLEEGHEEPVRATSRIRGQRGNDALVLSKTMTQQVLTDKKSFLTSDTRNDDAYDGMMSMISQGIRSAIAVPLFDNEDVIGILYADDSRPGRSFTRDQLAAFTLLANIIAVALTHSRYHEMEMEKRRQDAQLATAGDILDHILPNHLPALEGYDVLASLEPCFEVGGDLYDAQIMPDGRYAFLIGDVVGKGLGAALLVSHILSWSRFMVLEGWDPEPLITRLNQQIFCCTDYVRFATFFLGYLEPDTGKVTYVNAGHNPPYVVRADGTVEDCAPTGLPVGMMEESKYRTGEITLGHGDLLALFSDGIPETQRIDDEEYGEENFKTLLVRERGSDLQELFSILQGELAEFRGDAEIGDDITLVTLRRK